MIMAQSIVLILKKLELTIHLIVILLLEWLYKALFHYYWNSLSQLHKRSRLSPNLSSIIINPRSICSSNPKPTTSTCRQILLNLSYSIGSCFKVLIFFFFHLILRFASNYNFSPLNTSSALHKYI